MKNVAPMQSAPGPEILVEGKPYLYFGGTSYLGLAANSEVIKAGCEALRKYGVHSATTRAGIGTIPPVGDVERLASEFFDSEDAFYFGSGYASNHVLVATLGVPFDVVVVEEGAHYCVKEAAKMAGGSVLEFRHHESMDLARKVEGLGRVLVMADAVGAATGICAPVVDYLEVLRGCPEATLILDDAHGFGVLGGNGRGLLEELGLLGVANRSNSGSAVEICVGGTLAKGLGGFGGIVVGTKDFVRRAKGASHYYEGASAPASAIAGSSAKALEIVLREPAIHDQLVRNIRILRAGLAKLGLETPEGHTAHLGLSIGDSRNMERIHKELKQRGILAPYLQSYSGTPSDGLLRIAVFANHTETQISTFVETLGQIL
jgi:8-amino-7-oxononanoate synthase